MDRAGPRTTARATGYPQRVRRQKQHIQFHHHHTGHGLIGGVDQLPERHHAQRGARRVHQQRDLRGDQQRQLSWGGGGERARQRLCVPGGRDDEIRSAAWREREQSQMQVAGEGEHMPDGGHRWTGRARGPRRAPPVTRNVSDARSNTSSFTITTPVTDSSAESINCLSATTLNAAPGVCTSNVTFVVTNSDNCPGVTVVSVPASGFAFPVGATTVTSKATDASGNTASFSFTVTVNDTQPPAINCPSDITVNAAPGVCTIGRASCRNNSDNCPGVTVVSVPASGFAFPVGATTVTSTATDASGNTASCSFTVTVNDTQPPAINGQSYITANAAPGVCTSNVTFVVTNSDN